MASKQTRPRKLVRRRRTGISAVTLEKAMEGMTSVTCAFCGGTGKDPFGLSKLSVCPVCHGNGTVKVTTPYEKCKACDGTGVYIRSHLYCWPCRGKGVVPKASQE